MTEINLCYGSFSNKRVDPINQYTKIEAITDGALSIRFKKPIYAKFRREGKQCFLDFDKLNVYVVENTYKEAMASFMEYLLSLKENYIDCDESELAASGLLLKQELKEYF